jgi:hypothetical protein
LDTCLSCRQQVALALIEEERLPDGCLGFVDAPGRIKHLGQIEQRIPVLVEQVSLFCKRGLRLTSR